MHTFSNKGRFAQINKCVRVHFFIKEIVRQTGLGTRVRLELKLTPVSRNCIYCLIVFCVIHITYKNSSMHKGHQVKASA